MHKSVSRYQLLILALKGAVSNRFCADLYLCAALLYIKYREKEKQIEIFLSMRFSRV